MGITLSYDTRRQGGNLNHSKVNGGSYSEQDADSTGHANLSHTHYCHFIPGGLRRTAEQWGDELLQD